MKRSFFRYPFLCLSLLSLLPGCTEKPEKNGTAAPGEAPPLFSLVPPDSSNIHFQNELVEGPNANVLMYEYLYNGGGVAAGDFNGDGLIDLYFTSNMGSNKFYMNQGGLKFLDKTEVSGLGGRPGPWKTGITAADVNGDGRLDLYLCYSGALPPEKRRNQLFINTGNNAEGAPIFEEQAGKYDLDSEAFSNQGYFFDYDRDGDLDMILLNHNPKSLPILNVMSTREILKQDDPLQGIRLYRQDDGRFTDVTLEAGISGSSLTYGLGIGISDLDGDGWQDFYVSNDYAVPDYLYINLKNGTFVNQLDQSLGHTSHFSMGNDIADVNNDGQQDILTLDMLPEDNRRQKLLMAPDNYDKFDLNVRSGFHYQYMRNMLQLNNGEGSFSEIGQQAGISNTDWSWAALLADYDNDGWKDLFVTNGYFRDYTNLDFINYMEDYVQAKGRLLRQDVLDIVEKMPSSNLTNYLFVNKGDGTFADKTSTHGLDQPANSNGAAYADLDNDGDLELIVNNINSPAFIYRNKTDTSRHRYLQLRLMGAAGNTQGVGATATIYHNGMQQSLTQMPTRGYLSTISPVLHFGVGNNERIDSLTIQWNRGGVQTLSGVATNQVLVMEEGNSQLKSIPPPHPKPAYLEEVPSPLTFSDRPSNLNDFKRQALLIAQFSHAAPCMAKGDLNNDGLMDLFIGGSKGQESRIFLQEPNGGFITGNNKALALDKESHDSDAIIFDANGDGHADIYVASGGYHDFEPNDPRLQDRIYLGDGNGNFTKDQVGLPTMLTSSSVVAAADVNGDGNQDLFIGGRVVPGRYPEIPRSYILLNDGGGKYSDATAIIAPGIESAGMVTDALWTDLNSDGQQDLVLVGEWMPVAFYINKNGTLAEDTSSFMDRNYFGWWNTIAAADLNGDGKADFIAGNMGRNTQFNVNPLEPAELFYADFDQNGSVDPIFCFYLDGKSYPYVTRDELLGQLAYLRSKFTTYDSYADATLEDIFTDAQIKAAGRLFADHMETTLFLSTPEGRYITSPLPMQAQYSPVYKVLVADVQKDGNEDLILLGNNEFFKLRLGRFNANHGTLLLGNGKGAFEYVNQPHSGLKVKGDVRDAVRIGDLIYLGIYGQPVKTFKIKSGKD